MADKDFIEYLNAIGYENIVKIDNKWCGLSRFAFTTGLLVGLDKTGYERRYCFHNWAGALESLLIWDGKDHPSGNWIKCKGIYRGEAVDMANPNYEQ